MATDRRRAAATATTGAALTTAGGVLRHRGTLAANNGKIPEFDLRHPRRWAETHQSRALLRTGARGRRSYALGATLGLVGAPALAVGLHDTVTRRPVDKRDERRSFVREGLSGTQDALEQRAVSLKDVPPQHRAGPVAVSAGSGLIGSLAAHRGLDRVKSFQGRHHGGRAGLTALAGATLAGASYPLARHTVRSNDYEVTPTGVRRKKRTLVRPSTKANRARSQNRSLQADLSKADSEHGWWAHAQHFEDPKHDHFFGPHKTRMEAEIALDQHWESTDGSTDYDDQTDGGDVFHGLPPWRAKPAIRAHTPSERAVRQKRDERGRFAKAGDYAGRRTPTHAQRAAILAAGATPVIGGVAGARTAGHFAPPGERMHTETRQYGLTTAGSVAGGLAGAYGTSALAARHEGVAHATERAAGVHGRAKEKVLSLKPVNATLAKLPKGSGRIARAKEAAMGTKIARPLRRSPIAAGVGYVAGKTIGGYAGSGVAMQRNQHDQRDYNLKHPVVKLVDGMTIAERRKLSRKKRLAAASSTMTGVAGLGALGARVAHRPELGVKLLTAGAAIGGANSLNFAGVLRREAKAQDPRVNKGLTERIHMAWHGNSTACGLIGQSRAKMSGRWSQVTCRGCKQYRVLIGKAYVPAQRMWSPGKGLLVQTAGRAGQTDLKFGGRADIETRRHFARLRNGNKTGTTLRSGLYQSRADQVYLRVHKADNREPLTRMHGDTAAQLVRRHGDAGPLPATLSRSERMQAYEARYVHAGGHKAEHWQRRADRADKVKVAGLAGATAGGGAVMALRSPRLAARLGSRAHSARHAADTATIGAATVSGAGELYAGHARRRRASYSNSKAGVAASALRRMRDYQAS